MMGMQNPYEVERGLVEAAREIIAARRDNNCALSDYMTRLDNAYDALERALAVAAPSQPGTDADAVTEVKR
jgi:hypothetical protein